MTPNMHGDPITDENRRLQRENRQLRARVEALEESRWWKIHPRFLARRLIGSTGVRSTRQPSAASVEAVAPDGPSVDPLVTRFREELVGRESFAKDWFSGKYTAWEPIVNELEGRTSELLEIGSFEGLSACYLLWRLPEAKLTCIDTFAGSSENAAYGVSVAGLEERFDRNVALVDAGRVDKLVGESGRILPQLVADGRRFDLVYVDGSHHALDVLVDASLSWRLLTPGGVMIFDDYEWAKLGTDPLLRPGAAIDAFLGIAERHCEVLFRQRQVAVRKALSAA
jgi:SAM-dependent methyltransferase